MLRATLFSNVSNWSGYGSQSLTYSAETRRPQRTLEPQICFLTTTSVEPHIELDCIVVNFMSNVVYDALTSIFAPEDQMWKAHTIDKKAHPYLP
jgi:hypothetical protein